ncbi:MAG: GCN5-related N-acetyltransferase [Actinoallomurus sp.]|nr:GCN5-related N-acetyltransferase [Actinoallomurus sp.]
MRSLFKEERPLASIAIELHDADGDEAARRLDEYRDVYAEVHAEQPYSWGPEYADLFHRRFDAQRQQDGFALVEARVTGTLIGLGFGVALSPVSPWWQNLMTPLPPEVTEERPGRTWALADLMVRERWRRLHLAEAIHDRLLDGRPEERATMTVLPSADAAHAAALKWGWEKIGQKRVPLPGAPVFDVLVKTLGH